MVSIRVEEINLNCEVVILKNRKLSLRENLGNKKRNGEAVQKYSDIGRIDYYGLTSVS